MAQTFNLFAFPKVDLKIYLNQCRPKCLGMLNNQLYVKVLREAYLIALIQASIEPKQDVFS